MDSPPSYPSSPRRKEPWKAFITSPSEKLWCIHNATPEANSRLRPRRDALRRDGRMDALRPTYPPPEVKKPGGGLGMLERPGKRGEAEGP